MRRIAWAFGCSKRESEEERTLESALLDRVRLLSVPPLPAGWEMVIPGYAVDRGQSKSERKLDHVVRYCDTRGGVVRTWSATRDGVPTSVVLACSAAATDYPSEFAI